MSQKVVFKKHYYINAAGVPHVTPESIASWEDIVQTMKASGNMSNEEVDKFKVFMTKEVQTFNFVDEPPVEPPSDAAPPKD